MKPTFYAALLVLAFVPAAFAQDTCLQRDSQGRCIAQGTDRRPIPQSNHWSGVAITGGGMTYGSFDSSNGQHLSCVGIGSGGMTYTTCD